MDSVSVIGDFGNLRRDSACNFDLSNEEEGPEIAFPKTFAPIKTFRSRIAEVLPRVLDRPADSSDRAIPARPLGGHLLVRSR